MTRNSCLISDEVKAAYEEQVVEISRGFDEQKKRRDLPAVTVDGHRMEIVANIGGPKDVPLALEWGAEGVGLFRTEFLYMESNMLPTEEQQYQAYEVVAGQFALRPVIYRTLDVGGDKALPYLDMSEEENPFLGYRALRTRRTESYFKRN